LSIHTDLIDDSAKVLKEYLSPCGQFWAYGLLSFFNTKIGKNPFLPIRKPKKKTHPLAKNDM
jgi:hypothetical protein